MEKQMNIAGLGGNWLLFGLSAGVIVLDRLTKIVCEASLTEGVAVPVFPGFDLLLAYNTGAAFSFLSDAGGWQRWLLTAISLGVSVFIFIWMLKLPRQQKLLGLALALILGGALGNLYDRMLTGYVVDFVSVYFQDYRFATFNIADSAISIGAALMVLDIFLGTRRAETAGGEG